MAMRLVQIEQYMSHFITGLGGTKCARGEEDEAGGNVQGLTVLIQYDVKSIKIV